jgi:23S rRNA (guanosine2251-2'-O)-methyltransferase
MDHRRIKSGGGRPQRPALDLDDVMYGIHAVEEALAAGELLRRIHIGDDRKRDPAMRTLIERANESGATVRFEQRGFFAQFPYKAHQNVVAFGAPFGYVGLEDAIVAGKPGRPRLIVVLDHLTDPHNVGAIIRTAECAGADAVVMPERRAAGVNATVRKAAAGAAAHIPIARIANVASALRAMKKAGIWIAGAALDPSAEEHTKADFNRDLALVIGAEGGGISPVVRKECDYLVHIPLFGEIASLNASVAAGVLLYEARRQRN